jgi:integrase
MSKAVHHKRRGTPYIDTEANGVWYVYFSVGRRSKRESLGTREEGEALARFAEWIRQGLGQRGKVEGKTDYTVAELWGVYDEKHVQVEVMPNGRATIGYAWKNLEPHFGALVVADVPEAIGGFVALRQKAGAAPATIRREVATLLAGLRYCATKKGGKLIEAVDLDEVELPPDSEPRDRWLTTEEIKRLLDAAADGRRGDRLSRVERFIWLALFTTSRKQALLELTWDRVDFTTNTIHLDVPGRKKTKKRRADVSIATQLRPVLQRAYAERGENKLVLDHAADDVWASIQYVAIRAGFSDHKVAKGKSPKATGVSPHVLRHSGATHMARGGVPLWKIAKTLGNTSKVVEDVYAKWQPGDPSDTVDAIPAGLMEAAE